MRDHLMGWPPALLAIDAPTGYIRAQRTPVKRVPLTPFEVAERKQADIDPAKVRIDQVMADIKAKAKKVMKKSPIELAIDEVLADVWRTDDPAELGL